MSVRLDFFILLVALAVASYFCRAGGFWLMRFVDVTPSVKAALNAAPLAVMVGIVTPAAVRGNPPELIGLVVIAAVMRVTGNDLVAALAGVAAVAIGRMILGG